MTWTQVYDPAGHWWFSTLIAALPIIVLLGLLAGLKVRAHLCAVAGAATAVIVAIVAFKMPAVLAVSSFFYGAAFGLLKIVWIVIAAVFLYDISVATGQFEIMKQSVAAITPDDGNVQINRLSQRYSGRDFGSRREQRITVQIEPVRVGGAEGQEPWDVE